MAIAWALGAWGDPMNGDSHMISRSGCGRFHLVATPPDRGRNIYRVWFPSQGGFVGAVTRSVTITTP